MESLNAIQNDKMKKQEVVGIHANAILQKNIADAHDLNKRMDALCMDEFLAKKALGEEIYEEMKPQLGSTKKFLDTNNKKAIQDLPEFKMFLETYSRDEIKKQQKKITSQTAENIKDEFTTKAIPEDIKKTKEEENILNRIKNNIGSIIKKYEWERIAEVLRKNIVPEGQTQQIYEYLFEHMESPTNKKKRMINESISDFYKRSGIDYRCNDEIKKKIHRDIEKRGERLKEKIKKWEEKEKNTIEKNIHKGKNEEEKRDYSQEAIKIFIAQIDDNKDIKERFYLPKDKEDIEAIQQYFKKHLEETIQSPSKENFIKDYTTPLHTIEKAGNKIKINPNDYIEIERRKMEYKKRFTSGDRNPREYLFDRLTEYIGKDILAYKINNLIKKNPQYRGTKVSIEKTDVLDDSSAGADYIAIYSIPGKQKERIAAIDLFISEKSWGKSDDENEDKRKQKKESAKTGKIPYSTYIHIFENKGDKSYAMEPLKRYIEQLDPTLVYSIMAQIFKDKKTNITALLDEFDTRGALYTNIQKTTRNDRERTKIIEEQLHQNILNEFEKIAA